MTENEYRIEKIRIMLELLDIIQTQLIIMREELSEVK
jgi:hypothetical protein